MVSPEIIASDLSPSSILGDVIPQVDGLIIKLVQRCNLACTYCYMYEHVDQSYTRKPRLLSNELFQLTVDRMAEYLRLRPNQRVGVTLHGGEPTMVGVDRFRAFVEILRDRLQHQLSRVHVQTNGTLLNERWINLFRELKVEVGVSLDGNQQQHDRFRVDHFGRGSYHKVVDGITLLRNSGMLFTVLAVIDPASSGRDTYNHLRSLGIDHFDFLIPDVTHDSIRQWYPTYSTGQLAAFVISAFDEWFREDNPDISVRLFEDIIRLILGGHARTETIGNPAINYLVIDTDGNIQGSDALRVCDPGLCDTGLNVRHSGFDELPRGAPHIYHAMRQGAQPCSVCEDCPEFEVCGGGNMPHRYSRVNGFLNPSVWCEDLKMLLGHIRKRLANA
jgi:uncharacterized protein